MFRSFSIRKPTPASLRFFIPNHVNWYVAPDGRRISFVSFPLYLTSWRKQAVKPARSTSLAIKNIFAPSEFSLPVRMLRVPNDQEWNCLTLCDSVLLRHKFCHTKMFKNATLRAHKSRTTHFFEVRFFCKEEWNFSCNKHFKHLTSYSKFKVWSRDRENP